MKKYESIYQNIKGSIKRGGLKQLQTDDEVLSYLCKSLQDILQDLGEPNFQWYDNDWDDDQPEGSDTQFMHWWWSKRRFENGHDDHDNHDAHDDQDDFYYLDEHSGDHYEQ